MAKYAQNGLRMHLLQSKISPGQVYVRLNVFTTRCDKCQIIVQGSQKELK
jgi:hypothetical protein